MRAIIVRQTDEKSQEIWTNPGWGHTTQAYWSTFFRDTMTFSEWPDFVGIHDSLCNRQNDSWIAAPISHRPVDAIYFVFCWQEAKARTRIGQSCSYRNGNTHEVRPECEGTSIYRCRLHYQRVIQIATDDVVEAVQMTTDYCMCLRRLQMASEDGRNRTMLLMYWCDTMMKSLPGVTPPGITVYLCRTRSCRPLACSSKRIHLLGIGWEIASVIRKIVLLWMNSTSRRDERCSRGKFRPTTRPQGVHR